MLAHRKPSSISLFSAVFGTGAALLVEILYPSCVPSVASSAFRPVAITVLACVTSASRLIASAMLVMAWNPVRCNRASWRRTPSWSRVAQSFSAGRFDGSPSGVVIESCHVMALIK